MNVAAHNRRNIILSNEIEETEFNTSFNHGTTARTTMYMRDVSQFVKYRVSFWSVGEDFLWRQIGMSLRTDGTVFQTEPLPSAYFHGMYKSVRQYVFSNGASKVLCNDDRMHLPCLFVSFIQ